MKIYAPEYYKNFKCIADRCRHSCCVGWEIDIDSDTAELYSTVEDGYGKNIRESMDTEGVPHFRLAANDRCPHLNDFGLCRIILELGEGYLCEICREHPRFYNDTCLGKEVGLGMSCEEACRIILSSDGYDRFIPVGELAEEPEACELDTVALREKIYGILSDSSLPYTVRRNEISRLFGVTELDDTSAKELISSLEYLDENHRELFLSYSANASTPKNHEKALERALAYFIFRHCSEVFDADEYRAALGFCLFCEKLLASLIVSENAENDGDAVELARILSEEIEYSEDNTDAIISAFYDQNGDF